MFLLRLNFECGEQHHYDFKTMRQVNNFIKEVTKSVLIDDADEYAGLVSFSLFSTIKKKIKLKLDPPNSIRIIKSF